MTQPEQLAVDLYPPGIDTPTSISSRIVDLSFQTTAPGGDGDCNFYVHAPGEPQDHVFRAGSKVVIRDGSQVLYCGRIEEIGGDYVTDYARLPVTVRGYASSCDDQVYTIVKFWDEGKSVDTVFLESCVDLCPDISPGNVAVTHSGRTLPERTQDFVLSSARHIWETVAPLGGDGIPLVWRVYIDSVGIIPTLHLDPRPTAPALFCAMASGTIPIPGVGLIFAPGGTQVGMSASLRQVYNRVAVKITREKNACCYAVLVRNDDNSQSANGIDTIRTIGIDLTSLGEIDSGDAHQAASMMLSQVSSLENTGREITLDYPQYVLDTAGLPVPLWRIRAGQIIQVSDYSSGDDIRLFREFYIVGTRWDERRRRLSLSVGSIHGMPEGIGKAIRKKRPARSDAQKVDPTPETGREPKRGFVYDGFPHRGSTSHDTPYSPVDHRHGTPNGDVALTYGLDNAGTAITTPAETAMGLVRGTILSWKVRCNPGGSISYSLSFPGGTVQVRETTISPLEPVTLPAMVIPITSAMDGSEGPINLECASDTEVRVSVTGVPTATWASLVLRGTRNLTISEPLTPVERGVGAEGVTPAPITT